MSFPSGLFWCFHDNHWTGHDCGFNAQRRKRKGCCSLVGRHDIGADGGTGDRGVGGRTGRVAVGVLGCFHSGVVLPVKKRRGSTR